MNHVGDSITLVRIRRTVKWGECDPAGILYTPRAFDYITEAIEQWFRDVGGSDWMHMLSAEDIGAPTVHAACNYRSPMAPGLKVCVTVYLERIGDSSLTFLVRCEDEQRLYFEGTLVSCVISISDHRACPIPDGMRQRAETYAALPHQSSGPAVSR